MMLIAIFENAKKVKLHFLRNYCNHSNNSNRGSVALNLSRIDRFYADSFFWDRGGYVGIVFGTSFSNHALVLLKFCMDSHNSISRLYVPRFIVVDMTLQHSVFSLWRMVVGDSNCQKLQNVMMLISSLQQKVHNFLFKHLQQDGVQKVTPCQNEILKMLCLKEIRSR